MPESEYRRKLFTDKILALGLVTGSAPVCFLKGTYDSPYGQQRFISGTQVVHMNAPRFAGQCAVYSCLFDTFECTLISLTQKQDVWNQIVAGRNGCMGGLTEATIMSLFGEVVVATLRSVWRKKQQQMVSIEDDDLPKNKMSGTPS
ncbi:hypothetical protein QQ045_017237 [Rhodiola kirilowii]